MKRISITTAYLLLGTAIYAQQTKPVPAGHPQEYNPAITTGVAFLTITPDARSGALGDMGVATTADGFSQFTIPQNMFLQRSNKDSQCPIHPICPILQVIFR